ncbi:DUF3822 family protein [Bacteroidota bacterium]
MSELTKKFRLLKSEKDPKFNIDNLEYYNLLLQVGFSDFQLCVTDSRENIILLLEDYVMAGVTNQIERVECLKGIFDNHHLLLAGFWNKVKVLVKNRKFALVPSKVFLKDNIIDYLKINARLEDDSETFFYKQHKSLSLVNVFSIDSRVVSFIKKTYPTLEIDFHHQSSAFIHGFEKHIDGRLSSFLCMNLDRFSLQLLLIKNGQFKYYNQFPIKEFNDYLKFIGMVVREFRLDIIKDQFYIWGYLGEKSNHFNQLQNKFPNLLFGKRPPNLKFGYVFDEIPEHQYFDLLSFNLLSK